MRKLVIKVLGVHPIHADEPVWLVETEIAGRFEDVDWGSITQPISGKDRSYWQVPYDERKLETSSTGEERAVFFFHYLQLDRPFESTHGQLLIPKPTALPDRLSFVQYASP